MPIKQRIHLYCLCWNEARMLPFFFRHYDKFVDAYFVFDNGSTDESITVLENHPRVTLAHFDVTGDSFVDEERRLCDSIWRGSDADWVIVTDIDEHIYHPNLIDYLQTCTDQGITAIRSAGYEMVSDQFPSGDQPLTELVTQGQRSAGHDRLCIFNPKAITATNFDPGRHQAKPEGRVAWPSYPEVLLLHYKQLGKEYVIARSAELRPGLRSGDLEKRWGVHYTWSAKRIASNWRRLKKACSPVPGLGTLKHIPPTKYFEEEHTIQSCGLFDGKWYLAQYSDVEEAGVDPLLHFCTDGWKEGRKPNFYFDPEWYRAQYQKRGKSRKENPLYDYVVRGEKQGAWPSPLFNPDWYRAQNGLSVDESPLLHYLLRRSSGLVSPLPDFDVVGYCQNHPEITAVGADPFENYCTRDE
jgi:Glycosyl transferase family 2